ncbi:MAG: T9SS type A sorting domain-containing protein [Bacteroidota bacterium]
MKKGLLSLWAFLLFTTAWGQVQIGVDLIGCTNCRVANSVTISDNGDRMAIGNPGVSGNAGAVEIFTVGSTLTFTGALFPPPGSTDDFGTAVAIAGDASRLAIGSLSGQGSVTIWGANGPDWLPDGTLLGDMNAGQAFGSAIDFSQDGSRIVIGDPGFDDMQGANNIGAVTVYERINYVWTPIGSTLRGTSMDSYTYGFDVAISGDGQRLVVGDYTQGTTGGKVYVYQWENNDWAPLGAVIEGEAGLDQATGISVDINHDGSRIVVGASNFGIDEAGANATGAATVYEWQTDNWVQQAQPVLGEAIGDAFGRSVSIDSTGNRIAVGAPNDGSRAGYTKVFDWFGVAWFQVGENIDGLTVGDLEGFSVDLSGNSQRLLIGAPGNNPNTTQGGLGRVFEFIAVSSTQETVISELIRISPNPTTDFIQLNGKLAEAVQVFNANGQLVLTQQNVYELDLSALPGGLYLIKGQSEGNWFHGKVFKQ